MLARPQDGPEVALAEKVAFLSDAAYPERTGPVTRRETHMSWVFFVDGAVYKLKKPVRPSYLDFSTLERREAACRAEYALNQTLAPGVYLGLTPLVRTAGGLRLGGAGEVVDWLVRMRRLDETQTLESRIRAHDVQPLEIDGLARALARFYRRAPRVRVPVARHIADWRAIIGLNAQILLSRRHDLPAGAVRSVLAVQRRFLDQRRSLLAARAQDGRILDAHGDLRPEHIWPGPPMLIIDRLEFSRRLRAVDPFDEIAFLDVETEHLGAPEIGARVRARVAAALNETPPPELYLFYRTARAMLRARLAIAHLLEPEPRTPEKWPRQARGYLAIALRDANRLATRLRTRADP